jgi:hypothetical protein
MSLPLLFTGLAVTVLVLFLVQVYWAWRTKPNGKIVFLATLIVMPGACVSLLNYCLRPARLSTVEPEDSTPAL